MPNVPQRREKRDAEEVVQTGVRLPKKLYRKSKVEAAGHDATVQQFIGAVLVVYFSSPKEHKQKVWEEVSRAA